MTIEPSPSVEKITDYPEQEPIPTPDAVIVVLGSGLLTEKSPYDGYLRVPRGDGVFVTNHDRIYSYATPATYTRACAAAELAHRLITRRVDPCRNVHIVTSGGFTNRMVPQSEAGEMKRLIEGMCGVPCYVEDRSFDTGTNIEWVMSHLCVSDVLREERCPPVWFITSGSSAEVFEKGRENRFRSSWHERPSIGEVLTGMLQYGSDTFRIETILRANQYVRSLRRQDVMIGVLPAEYILSKLNPALHQKLGSQYRLDNSVVGRFGLMAKKALLTHYASIDPQAMLAREIARRTRRSPSS